MSQACCDWICCSVVRIPERPECIVSYISAFKISRLTGFGEGTINGERRTSTCFEVHLRVIELFGKKPLVALISLLVIHLFYTFQPGWKIPMHEVGMDSNQVDCLRCFTRISGRIHFLLRIVRTRRLLQTRSRIYWLVQMMVVESFTLIFTKVSLIHLVACIVGLFIPIHFISLWLNTRMRGTSSRGLGCATNPTVARSDFTLTRTKYPRTMWQSSDLQSLLLPVSSFLSEIKPLEKFCMVLL